MIPEVRLVYAGTDREFQLPDNVEIVGGASKAADIDLSAGIDVYKQCSEEGINLTQYLERRDPSRYDGAGKLVGLDAYQRQLRLAGIVPVSFPEEGRFASKGERFFQAGYPASKVLFPEFIDRVVRMVLLRPATIDAMLALTRMITSATYQAMEITWDEKDVRKKRTPQMTEFPIVKLAWSDTPGKVQKYGREVQTSYEFIREASLDILQTAITLIMTQTRVSESDDAVATMWNQVADSYIYKANGSQGLDTASSAGQGNLTYNAWLAFALEFFPYQVDTIVAGKKALIKWVTMSKPGADIMEVLAALQEGPATVRFRLEQNIWGPVTLIYNSAVPDDNLLCFQKEYALERILQVGGDITEMEKMIRMQFSSIILSEMVGFGILFPQVIRILKLN